MPFTPHRRHAITSVSLVCTEPVLERVTDLPLALATRAQLLSVVGPICLYQYLLAPNITVFLIRLVTQTRMYLGNARGVILATHTSSPIGLA